MGINRVTEMDNFIGGPSLEDLPTEDLRWMLGFWNNLRGDRDMPARSDFSPADMVPLLPYISLIDVESDPQRFRIRLVGTGIVAESGVDLTGHYQDELKKTEKVIERCDWMVKNRQPLYAQNVPLDWASLDFSSYGILMMPLSADGENVDMLLGFVDFG